MTRLKRYKKKSGAIVTAVQLKLETPGFQYRKWGGEQHCKADDWIVDNQGDCYTIDAESFARTYRQTSPGVYSKTQEVWAEVAKTAGSVRTKEGSTDYQAGDYLVANNPDGSDDYAVSKTTFEASYEQLAEPG